MTGRMALLRMTEGMALLRMTEGEAAPQGDGEGERRCRSEPPPVIPNGVRNLRSPSNDRTITTTTQRMSQHLRFFVVRSSE